MKTLLQCGERTVFEYRIEGGMDKRDCDEWEAMDSIYVLDNGWPPSARKSLELRHRMEYARRRHFGFSFLNVKDPDFAFELESVSPMLPYALADMTSDFYRNGTAKITDLLDNLQPSKNIPSRKNAKTVVKEYLARLTEKNEPE